MLRIKPTERRGYEARRMSGYAASLKELLKQAGCYFVRKGRGDHGIWQSPKSKIMMSVATNNAVILRRAPKARLEGWK